MRVSLDRLTYFTSKEPMIARIENEAGNIVDRLLESQQQLTAVEKFSQRHRAITAPAMEFHYQDLILLDTPGENELTGYVGRNPAALPHG